jgi:hypothetical protein
MSMIDQIRAAKEEIMDQWFYLCALEQGLHRTKKFLLTKN